LNRVTLIGVGAGTWKCISGGCNSYFFGFAKGMSVGDAEFRYVSIMSLSIGVGSLGFGVYDVLGAFVAQRAPKLIDISSTDGG